MERADPLFLLIGLPMVPVSLILSKMIRWEDFILRLWRKHCSKLPLISHFFQPGVYETTDLLTLDHRNFLVTYSACCKKQTIM